MQNKLKPGDLLYRKKGIVEHAGVYLGQDRVIHNSPNGNTQITSLKDYSNEKEVKVISNNFTKAQQENLITEAENYLSIDKKYNLLNFNCEHLASAFLEEKPSSKQLQGAALGAGTAFALAHKMKSNNLLLLTILGGAIGCAMVNSMRKYDHLV
ncbi:hypothetical protein EI16_03130 [Hydrogenovibrio marinus]|uniref:LRAT domain-containing protein n=2 Tax=Hydrogenovibrio marinus TaxID=28885 RepID=A0A066ZYY0_HYDMR|nr:hypothetical protein EI16_03130 [Hydrogenovibrio marinus]BBN59792.1 hypothetical protein HVMH_1386 [Hydrogenovibrio marinus]